MTLFQDVKGAVPSLFSNFLTVLFASGGSPSYGSAHWTKVKCMMALEYQFPDVFCLPVCAHICPLPPPMFRQQIWGCNRVNTFVFLGGRGIYLQILPNPSLYPKNLHHSWSEGKTFLDLILRRLTFELSTPRCSRARILLLLCDTIRAVFIYR